ncbi:MAG TPA: glycoside hydrolase [Clostridiales bacterium]|nr:glycoside hydrolase [Clostridiales bacterium]
MNATRQEGQALSKQIQTEGSVLVKNDGVLPFSDDIDCVNVFGWRSVDWVNSGSGSGRAIPYNNSNIGILAAIDSYDKQYNKSLESFYTDFRAPKGYQDSIGLGYGDFYKLIEPAMADYSETLKNEAKEFSDTAIVVIGRVAGETEDPPRKQYKEKTDDDNTRHYLEISKEEEDMLKYVGETYKNVVVIVNSTNCMELDFMDSIKGLDACLVVGATGTEGALALPEILWGETQPSGKLTDIYAYDMSTNINYYNTSKNGIGHYSVSSAGTLYPSGTERNSGGEHGNGSSPSPAYIDYIEGIYVGYKWYETADAEGYWNSVDNSFGKGYEGVVQYPFGYGLSYTEFSWNVIEITPTPESAITDKTPIKIRVNVTNTGNVSGQDVVEAYVTVPYTKGGIEKAHVSLVGFAKTHTIEPGGNEIVDIEIDPYDFASYDCYDDNGNGFYGYELEKGDYRVKLMTDSHTVKKVKYSNTEADGVFTYKVEKGLLLEEDNVTGNKVSNKFTGESAVESTPIDGSDGQNIKFVTRENFPSAEKLREYYVDGRDLPESAKKYNTYSTSIENEWNNAKTDIFGNAVSEEKVTIGKDNGKYKLYADSKMTDLGRKLAADYNAPEWTQVLDSLTAQELNTIIYQGGYGTAAIPSVGKPRLSDRDGPNQVNGFNSGARGTGFPCSTVLAQTWNKNLVYSYGLNYGKEMTALNFTGTYGFGINLHRSAWGGRNYEYLSEDAFLTGAFVTEEYRALKNTGHYGWLKHLVLYETEHERDSMYTWLTEQALREIYLKPFKTVIQKGGCVGIMSSYNRIGSQWTGGSESLITGVLRNEWGYKGAIITDYVDSWSVNFMAIENAVRAGADTLLGNSQNGFKTADIAKATPRYQRQAKETAHHIFYMWLNPLYVNENYNADDDVEPIVSGAVIEAWEWWKALLASLNVLIIGGCLVGVYFIVRDFFKDKIGLGKEENGGERA